MGNRPKILLVLPLLALLLNGCCKRLLEKKEPPPVATPPGAAGNTINGIPLTELPGTYTGSWGTMHMVISGNTVRAAYDHDNGFFVGQVSATGIRGNWCQGAKRGAAEFQFARAGRAIQLDGRWNYQESPGTWMDDWDLTKQNATNAVLAARAPAAKCP